MSKPRPHAQREPHTGLIPVGMGLLLFAPIVMLGSEIGAVLRFQELGSAVLFPPYALLTAALVASARRHWIWYILIAVAAHTIAGLPHWALSVGALLRRGQHHPRRSSLRYCFAGFSTDFPRLDGVPALFRFFASAVVIAPALGASIGAANAVLRGTSPTYGRPWLQWFLSSALTALTMLPGLFVAVRDAPAWLAARVDRGRVGEAVLLAGALGASCALAFFLQLSRRGDLTLLFYAPLPFLIWAALRFGSGGASLALTAVAIAAILGRGPRDRAVRLDVARRQRAHAPTLHAPHGAARALHRRRGQRAPRRRPALSCASRVAPGPRRHPRRTRDGARGQPLVAAIRRRRSRLSVRPDPHRRQLSDGLPRGDRSAAASRDREGRHHRGARARRRRERAPPRAAAIRDGVRARVRRDAASGTSCAPKHSSDPTEASS